MTKISLSQNKFTIIDKKDFKFLNKYKWSFSHGYAQRTILGKKVYMHRIILKAKKGFMIDHINRNTLDNRKQNLRFCDKSTNGMNRGKNKNNTSGYKGVSRLNDHFREKPYRTRVRQKTIGYFKTAKEASIAYNKSI